ncbi:uncharacterized protein LOC114931734 [Nylanderia fulva]|uniref:uncharacterized protein LOC114931734 n=1 Tax=Nylanderia fulva TaxID=613905 RepID=UPI0010FAE897|nr:uncharacterized protein LOC114931734 [Nylanderia fulva]
MLVKKNEDGTLGHRVYRKPIHRSLLHATSHHHPTQKNSVINSLIYRVLTISEPTSLNEELEHLNQVLTKNGYNSKDINRTTERLKNKISSSTNTSTSSEKEEDKKWSFRIFRVQQNALAGSWVNTTSKLETTLHLETSGVYKTPCSCRKVYIGKTGRKISIRIKEHQRSAKYCYFSQSALAKHWMETRHSVQYDKATRLVSSHSYFARKYRETLEILKYSDNLNKGCLTNYDKSYQTNPIWHP